ncbi:SDR family oxidoreductase [Hymenobacter chitinivorans]|uniref:NAD(P)-dependent dehydrogenase (Short-subunit alcohol dehydrogenase family) n=1 Tax=Hymenobacter chitinivorans DSM 11115 TaxID=1121954 RepID=A0A2M9BPP4_9BACT|nr:SDR family oxidoreductase [Hymenobacter chitinivorans]PJJ59926.1 NAD(P)-dependent dehydrogenase (short-subunit alcohol dehydrogenase family) [Hymenobacter chitinivorans DSM 11115]
MHEQITPGVLIGQRVVVLGGSAGIGLATAQLAAAVGAQVVIVSSNQPRLEAALQSLPGASTGHLADLTQEAQLHALFERIGAFDHLVFTAGESLLLGELVQTDLSLIRRAFELRYYGALAAVKHAQPYVRPGGSITLTSGIASRRPGKGWAVGASICGAIDALTRALAVELAPIRVNNVAPGVVKTDLWAAMPAPDRAAMYAGIGQSLPVGRVGEAPDVAQTYLYLMQQRYGTGQSIVVDGGNVLV